MDDELKKYTTMITDAFSDETLHKVILSSFKSDLDKVILRPVVIRDEKMLSFLYKHKTNDVTKNYLLAEVSEQIAKVLSLCKNAILFSENNDVYFRKAKKRILISAKPPTSKGVSSNTHDHQKKRLISTDNNQYLQHLGVLSSSFQVKPSKAKKYRQICKFIELFDSMTSELDESSEVSVIDMGSGKGYLTFAIYDYLTHFRNFEQPVKVCGVERKPDLVNTCNTVAKEVGFDGLSFSSGDIDCAELNSANILVALHACDTATDDAIARGILSDMDVIVCAPCCHKFIRPLIKPAADIAPLLGHGILLERQAEILTDGIRAIILEANGYSTNVFEFIAQSHTAKNLMIVGKKKKNHTEEDKLASFKKLEAIKSLYGISEYYLETILAAAQQ